MSKMSLCALFAASVFAASAVFAADTRGYVQSGLIAHWDGIENVGRNTHSSDTNEWIDLVAGRAFTLTGVTVNDDRMSFKGSASSYGQLPEADTTLTFGKVGAGGTIEIVLKADSTANAIAFQSPTTILAHYNNGLSIVYCASNSNKPELNWCWDNIATNTVALYYNGSLVQNAAVNGEAVGMSTTANYFGTSGKLAVLGTRQARNNNHFKGSIYAIRLYDRELTADERARNAALDAKRFFGGETEAYENFVTVTGNVGDFGAVDPDYGVYDNLTVGQDYGFSAPSCVTNANGMYAYECVGWELKRKDGTVTTNTAENVRNCTFTYTEAMDGATLTWRWGNRTVRGDKTYFVDVETGDDGYTGADIGSEEHPFCSVNAAHTATTNYLANNVGQSVLISIGEGSYPLTNYITLVAGERICGAGRDLTGINLRPCTYQYDSSGHGDQSYAIKLTASDNYLGCLSVTNYYQRIYHAPKTVWMSKGRVEHYRGAYGRNDDNYGYGLGLYMEGGSAQYCLLDHNTGGAMYTMGAGLYISGGEFTDSEICYNVDASGRSGSGQAVYISGGSVRRCKIHHNNEAATGGLGGSTGGGVYVKGGLLENCLVYKNGINGATKVGGVYNTGGTVRYCTIYGNMCSGDTQGYSGFCQASGTAINNIIFGNFVEGAVVSGGTFVTNILGAAVTGYGDNIKVDDVGFNDAANFDFSIPKRSSPAVEHAHPIAEVESDYVGVARAAKPTIGAYEYDASKEVFEVALQILKDSYLYGDTASANAIITGASLADVTIDWFVDGAKDASLANKATVELAGLGYGWHALRVEVTRDAETKSDEKAEAIRILPGCVYVNTTGRGKYPFASAEDGTNDLIVALDALWQNDNYTSRVEIAEGEYAIGRQLLLKYPVVVSGAGRDKTTVTCKEPFGARGVYVNHAAACVKDLAVSGFSDWGGVQIDLGVVSDCCITNCRSAQYHCEGPGVKVTGGRLINSEVVDCSCGNTYGEGGGVAMMKASAIVSNCLIRGCYSASSHENLGAGVYLEGGLLTHSRITDCGDHKPGAHGSDGTALYKLGSTTSREEATVRNVLIDHCESRSSRVVRMLHGHLENCTITENKTAANRPAVLLSPAFDNVKYLLVTVTNTVIWGNSGTNLMFAAEKPAQLEKEIVGCCCWPEAEEGVDGNTAKDPRFRGGKNRGLGVISSYGSCFRTGAVQPWMDGATDFRGNPRLTDGKVDIGCHQVGFDPGMMLLVK